MRGSLRLLASLLLCAVAAQGAAGCRSNPQGLGVALTLEFAEGAMGLSDAELGSVAGFDIHISGDETFTLRIDLQTLGRTALRNESLVYRPSSASRHIVIAADAVTRAGDVVAAGLTGPVDLSADQTIPALIVLITGAPLPDGGAIDAAADAANTDPGIYCGASYCDPTNSVCCYNSNNGGNGGVCNSTDPTCATPPLNYNPYLWILHCDDASDCARVGKPEDICCLATGFSPRESQCTSMATCTISPHRVLCDPSSSTPCPSGAVCSNNGAGFFYCQNL